MSNSILTQKTLMRKLMKNILNNISEENKAYQSKVVCDYLLNKDIKFRTASHVCMYLAMKHEELDTIPLIETILKNPADYGDKHIYIPHVERNSDMCFFELKNIEQYLTEMNEDNKFKLRQFNNPQLLTKADPQLFDLILVPGLAFGWDSNVVRPNNKICRLGRGKGYYDVFLSKIPNCHTIGIGFNEQFVSSNEELVAGLNKNHVPVDESKDFKLNEFICERMISF